MSKDSHSTHFNLLPQDWRNQQLSTIAALAPVTRLNWPAIDSLGVEVYVKRDELLHPRLSGNKFYKLYGYWRDFETSERDTLASFGGAYSNHLYALAALGESLQIPTIGIVRGERPQRYTPTMLDVQQMGMRLIHVSRSEYRLRHQNTWQQRLSKTLGNVFWVPEGGVGLPGAMGCAEWARQSLQLCSFKPDAICVASGTGCTAAGISSVIGQIPLHIFTSLKGSENDYEVYKKDIFSLGGALSRKLSRNKPYSPTILLETNYICGGYAKFPEYLREFVLQFEEQTEVRVDPVYTAKMFWGILQLAKIGVWSKGSKILAFHTGGLQGRRGLLNS